MPQRMSAIAKSLVEKFGEERTPTRKVIMMFNVGDQSLQLGIVGIT